MINIAVYIFLLYINAQVIDPELQRYFEKNYGYLKDSSLRDAPISSHRETNERLKDSLITYTLLPQPNYTEIPLHYDIKKQNTTGSISYYVPNPEDLKRIKFYSLVDIRIEKKYYNNVIKDLTSYGFLMAGEEYSPQSEELTIFGWLEDSSFKKVFKIGGVKSISLSSRNLVAPKTKLVITLKVPNNRDLPTFIDKFSEKLSEYGFIREKVEIVENDKKFRFSIIKLEGTLPIDKTRVITTSPFVINVQS